MSHSDSLKVVRTSKYRHIAGKKWTGDDKHERIRVGSGTNLSNLIKSNGDYFALPFDCAGGVLAYRSVLHFGKWSEEHPHLIRAHKKKISDFDFCPFQNKQIVATASFDENIKIWKLPEHSEYPEKVPSEEEMLITEMSPGAAVGRMGFHPYVNNVMYSTHVNKYIKLWDVEMKKERICIELDKFVIDSVSFNANGTQLITGSRDKKIRMFDLRSNNPLIATLDAHQSMKPFSVVWCDQSNPNSLLQPQFDYFFSVGFNRKGDREFILYDRRKLNSNHADSEMKSKPVLVQQTIDAASGQLTPFYDSDTRVLFLGGNGDGVIRYYEIVHNEPYCFYLHEYTSDSPQVALCKLPKTSCDVNQFEIARFLKVTNSNNVEIISMKVPKKDNIVQYFQEDIFPDTWNREATANANDWFEGKEIPLPTVKSLKPADKVSIFDVPEEEGGKKRPKKQIEEFNESSPTEVGSSGKDEKQEKIKARSRSVFMRPAGTPPTSPKSPTSASSFSDSTISSPNNDTLVSSRSVVTNDERTISKTTTSTTTTTTTTSSSSMVVFGYIGFGFLFFLKLVFIVSPTFIYRLIFRGGSDGTATNSENSTQQDGSRHDGNEKSIVHVSENVEVKRERTLEERMRSGAEMMNKIQITDDDLKIRPHDTDPSLKCKELDPVLIKKGKQPVLMKTRGRLKTRTVIVPLSYKSLTMKDSFVLDHGTKIYHWNGKKANRIVRVAAAEIAHQIRQKERGGDGATFYSFDCGKEPDNLQQKKALADFWKLLGLTSTREENEAMIPTLDTEITEDDYHTYVDKNQRIFQMNDEAETNEEVLIEIDVDGHPSYKILDSNNIYIIHAQSGKEVYVWVGKKSKIATRKWAIAVGRKFADLAARNEQENEQFSTFARVIEEGEFTIFKQKFSDYPSSLMIQTAPKENKAVSIAPKQTQVEINFQELLKQRTKLKTVKKQSSKAIELASSLLRIWRVDKHDKVLYPENFHGHFFSEDSFIVLHSYKKIEGGKDYFKLYYWQGRDCNRQERGTSAFKTVEIGSEITDSTAHHVRVVQSKEAAAFVQLFTGKYVVHKGHFTPQFFENTPQRTSLECKLYDIRSLPSDDSDVEEKSVHAVQCDSIRSMYVNSHYCCILYVARPSASAGGFEKTLYLWNGQYCHDFVKKQANLLSHFIQASFGVPEKNLISMKEGSEDSQFWNFFRTKEIDQPQKFYMKQLHSLPVDAKPKLFVIDDASGLLTIQDVTNFVPVEPKTPDSGKKIEVVKSSFSNSQEDDVFGSKMACDSFSQEDLQTEKAYIMHYDNCSIFVWIGSLCHVNVKRFALKSCVQYVDELKKTIGTDIKMYVVYEYREPLDFIAAFHAWSDQTQNVNMRKRQSSKPVTIIESELGRPAIETLQDVRELLAKLEVSTYSYERLTKQPLPEGVDATKLEDYLSNEEFEKVFNMTREKFQKLPQWKTSEVKKKVGLF